MVKECADLQETKIKCGLIKYLRWLLIDSNMLVTPILVADLLLIYL